MRDRQTDRQTEGSGEKVSDSDQNSSRRIQLEYCKNKIKSRIKKKIVPDITIIVRLMSNFFTPDHRKFFNEKHKLNIENYNCLTTFPTRFLFFGTSCLMNKKQNPQIYQSIYLSIYLSITLILLPNSFAVKVFTLINCTTASFSQLFSGIL